MLQKLLNSFQMSMKMFQFLQTYVTFWRKLVTEVLKAIKVGDQNNLFECNLRCDSLLATDWLQKFE